MSKSNFTIKLITPKRVINSRISTAIANHLNTRIPRTRSRLEQKAQMLLLKHLNASQETMSLLSRELRSELGIPNPSSEIIRIFEAVASTVSVQVNRATKKGSRGVSMSIRLTAVPFDLKSITSGMGVYNTEKGVSIPWFDWLTTLGDRVIVRDYEIEGGHPQSSRTGDAIMVKGKGWRVPPSFSGTENNNFVTRATDKSLPELGKSIETIIKATV